MSADAFPPFVDMRRLADELADLPDYARLRSAIERAAKVQSCAADLAQASDCCDAIEELKSGPWERQTITRGTMDMSLLQVAVLLYERATAAAGKRGERGSTKIADRLTEEQRRDHETITQVRQRAVAHVYTGESIDGLEWHQDLFFGFFDDGVFHPAHATNRVQLNTRILRALRRQIPVAQAILRERFHARLDRVTNALNENPLPMEIFLKHRFDPVAIFGNPQAVRAIIAGRADGEATVLS